MNWQLFSFFTKSLTHSYTFKDSKLNSSKLHSKELSKWKFTSVPICIYEFFYTSTPQCLIHWTEFLSLSFYSNTFLILLHAEWLKDVSSPNIKPIEVCESCFFLWPLVLTWDLLNVLSKKLVKYRCCTNK